MLKPVRLPKPAYSVLEEEKGNITMYLQRIKQIKPKQDCVKELRKFLASIFVYKIAFEVYHNNKIIRSSFALLKEENGEELQ